MQEVNLIIQLSSKSGDKSDIQVATLDQLKKLKETSPNLISLSTQTCLNENISCHTCCSEINIGIHIIERMVNMIEVTQDVLGPTEVFIKTEKIEPLVSEVKLEPEEIIDNDTYLSDTYSTGPEFGDITSATSCKTDHVVKEIGDSNDFAPSTDLTDTVMTPISQKLTKESPQKKRNVNPSSIPANKIKYTSLKYNITTDDDFLSFYNKIQEKNPKLSYYEIFTCPDGMQIHCAKLSKSSKRSIYVATFDLRTNKCDVCGHSIRFQSLFHHRNLHFFEPKGGDLKCVPCGKVFSTRELLEIHVNFCRKKKTYIGHRCKICDKQYTTHYNLREHEVTHFPGVNKEQKQAQMCEICSVVCANEYRLRDHKRRKHKINQFICNECGHKLPSITNIRQHLIRKHFPHLSEFVCEICSAPFSVEGMLNYHMKCAHGETYEIKCPLCDKVFKNGKNYLYSHMQSHKDAAERKKFYCDICNKVFMCKGSLKKHRELHSDPETWKYECTTCKQRFSRETYMKQHVKAHHQLSFRCEFCGKMFGRKISLIDHRNTHTGERPYKCLLETCDQSFRDRGNFNQHLKKHEKALGIKLTLTKEESRLKRHKLIDIKLDTKQ